QWKLRKGTQHFLLDFVLWLVVAIPDVLPNLPLHLYVVRTVRKFDNQRIALAVDMLDKANLPVVETTLLSGIVAHEHHRRAQLEGERRLYGIHAFGKITAYVGTQNAGLAGQLLERLPVNGIGPVIVGCQRNVGLALTGHKIRLVVSVQLRQHVGIAGIVANGVEEVDKAFLLLPVDVLKLEQYGGMLPQHPGIEEERRRIIGLHDAPLSIFNDGRKLVHIAYKQHLQPPERAGIAPRHAQYGVDGIECIGPQHRHFVYNEQVQLAKQLPAGLREAHRAEQPISVIHVMVAFVPIQPILFHVGAERQLEQGMQGGAARVHGRYARRSRHRHLLVGMLSDIPQEGRLARTSLSRQENMLVAMVYKRHRVGKSGIFSIER